MTTNNNIASSVLSTSNLAAEFLGVNYVDKVVLTADAVGKILSAQAKQFPGFIPSRHLVFPKNTNVVGAIGCVAMTAMAMIDKSTKDDFKPCHEDMAAFLHLRDFPGKKYAFMRGGFIDPKNESAGNDLIIHPDGMVMHYFDANEGLKEEQLVKWPRTLDEIQAEKGMTEAQKTKYRGDISFNIFPTLFNKSYYANNPDAQEQLVNLRAKVARAIAHTNHKAGEGQIVQVLILGFVSSYYIMNKARLDSIKENKNNPDIPIQPYGLGLFMPAWTILSRSIDFDGTAHATRALRDFKQRQGKSTIVNLRKLGYGKQILDPVQVEFDHLINDFKAISPKTEEAIVNTISELSENEIGIVKEDVPIEEAGGVGSENPSVPIKRFNRKQTTDPIAQSLEQLGETVSTEEPSVTSEDDSEPPFEPDPVDTKASRPRPRRSLSELVDSSNTIPTMTRNNR